MKITKIEATKTASETRKNSKRRVAAYCRVSTAFAEQLESLENQTQAFLYKLKSHPEWENAGIYVDEGITGTSVRRRAKFLEMIKDCKAGKIDFIVTKSISRFARNTIDCLKYVRELKEYGVNIWFEKEGIDTSSSTSEMLLTLMASFAQEESRSISENLKWGIRKRFEEGIDMKIPTYGYRHTEDKAYIVVPEEAVIVQEIYTRFVHGEAPMEIMRDMIRRGEKAPANDKWERQQIDRIMKNERYTGDSVLQKSYIENHLTHKARKNNGELPKYLVENAHPAIISKHLFEQARKIMEMRNQSFGNPTYPYGDMLKCPHCGKTLVKGSLNSFYAYHKTIKSGGWGCYGEGGCGEYLLPELFLNEALIRAYKDKYGEEKKSAEFYWIDDTIEGITLTEDTVIVRWKDGTVTSTRMKFDEVKNMPSEFAKTYNIYISRIRSGELKERKKNMMGLSFSKAV